MKYPYTSSSGVIASEDKVLIHNWIIPVEFTPGGISNGPCFLLGLIAAIAQMSSIDKKLSCSSKSSSFGATFAMDIIRFVASNCLCYYCFVKLLVRYFCLISFFFLTLFDDTCFDTSILDFDTFNELDIFCELDTFELATFELDTFEPDLFGLDTIELVILFFVLDILVELDDLLTICTYHFT